VTLYITLKNIDYAEIIDFIIIYLIFLNN